MLRDILGRYGITALILAATLALASGAAEAPSAVAWLAQAQQAFRKGDLGQASDLAAKALEVDPKSDQALYFRGRISETQKNYAKAVTDYSRVIELQPGSADGFQARGACYFRMGEIAKSISDFDQVIKLAPSQEPYHWQRGISHYYAGRFADGRKQFELHQRVNGNDVENAVWHFLCVARLDGIEAARAALIPISGDKRVPMKEVHELFAGKGTEETVLAAAKNGGGPQGDGMFYARLYLGLYYEAIGAADKSLEQIRRAATEFKAEHYMGDVARVHYKLRTSPKP